MMNNIEWYLKLYSRKWKILVRIMTVIYICISSILYIYPFYPYYLSINLFIYLYLELYNLRWIILVRTMIVIICVFFLIRIAMAMCASAGNWNNPCCLFRLTRLYNIELTHIESENKSILAELCTPSFIFYEHHFS